jgi:hypothetical protein
MLAVLVVLAVVEIKVNPSRAFSWDLLFVAQPPPRLRLYISTASTIPIATTSSPESLNPQ